MFQALVMNEEKMVSCLLQISSYPALLPLLCPESNSIARVAHAWYAS
jgi:hypothetical protein